MAKSLRAKRPTANRRRRRTDDKSPYVKVHDARLDRLSSKLKQSALGPVDREENDDGFETDEDAIVAEEEPQAVVSESKDKEEAMPIDGTAKPAPKISTSGERSTGRQTWKHKKGLKTHKRPNTQFKKGKKGKLQG
ncbi:uncharacterized protein L969DRAFT_46790 [Mixia osmundae IAM 14324]|uniref:DUF2423 domain-containing protein n=1 Tax=Mixia osmundae (strain CBS 9802 / IAM 14324 / JCM 22182 / KY 12970) TaxID=764103 RepID=G7E583_MIXOS|nr:uncharacterized protein L969DRAFT_46790 [Mixia osmundae IAM 14324]KEI40857.1 hypothetical protein L969DRAFT_46790 [Mixia osmundae IAM 14324]GAA97993.1 hypothetical protein E5Q_04673 [Mixia osmundae IAM 14324]